MSERLIELLLLAQGERTLNNYARQAGVDPGNYSRILKGQKTRPDILEKLASRAHNGVTYERLLMAAGYLSTNILFTDNKADYHFIEAMPATNANQEFIKIPILSEINAEQPLLTHQNIIGHEYISKIDAPNNNGQYFFLKIKDDSMAGSRILEGDLVLVKQQTDVDDGDIAVVVFDNDTASLKRVYKTDSSIVLQPDNPKYKPLVFEKNKSNIKILGKALRVTFKIK